MYIDIGSLNNKSITATNKGQLVIQSSNMFDSIKNQYTIDTTLDEKYDEE